MLARAKQETVFRSPSRLAVIEQRGEAERVGSIQDSKDGSELPFGPVPEAL
jgi:hypothetical protein